VKVFDNLYFVGQTGFSAWAVTTSAGIILIDALWDYSVEDEVVGGFEKLGLDPGAIRYVVVSHDHAGGASYLQSRFGAPRDPLRRRLGPARPRPRPVAEAPPGPRRHRR